jgi:hypothetical protein
MRMSPIAAAVALVLALLSGSATAGDTLADQSVPGPVQGVTGGVTIDLGTSLGDFSVSDGVFEYRAVPKTGSATADDPRLVGRLESIWNWDVLRDGTQPVPAWGTMRITPEPVAGADGAWTGTFTAIRQHDFEPFRTHAFLIGEGAYDGLCAILEIAAEPGAEWALEGVVHRLPAGA